MASAEPSPWSHLAAHSVVSTAWEELGRAMPKQEAWQVLRSCQHMHSLDVGFILHIARVAGLDAANRGRNRGRSSSCRRAGDGGRLSESAGSEGEEGGGVLHFDG